jgi:ATP-dependent DNA helicase RecG
MTLDEVLYMAHYPSSEEDAYEAHKVLERLAAIISVSHLRSAAKLPIIKRPQILYPDWLELVKNVPFQLTQEQLDGIEHLMNAFAQPHTTTTLINGDVGMGKSVIYQVAVIAAVKAGSRVAILVKKQRLAIKAY